MSRSVPTILALIWLCMATAFPAVAQRPVPRTNHGGPNRPTGSVTWNGTVDEDCTVFFQGGRSWIGIVRGRPVRNTSFRFTSPLPTHRPVRVRLFNVRGRGIVQIDQQPRADNDYTAEVLIRDLHRGRAFYHFRLEWNL